MSLDFATDGKDGCLQDDSEVENNVHPDNSAQGEAKCYLCLWLDGWVGEGHQVESGDAQEELVGHLDKVP